MKEIGVWGFDGKLLTSCYFLIAGASEAIRLVRPEPYHFLLQALLLKRPNPV